MARGPHENLAENDCSPVGPYDGAAAEEGLWFLPDETFEAARAPLPRADRRKLTFPQDWAVAQAALSAELAQLALLYGALEERLRAGPAGWRHRLALLEVADLSWWVGDRISAERLALWEALRLSGVQEDAGGLARASWALRRLAGGPGPDTPGPGQGQADFLGRQGPEVADLRGLVADLAHLHPVTRAVALFHGWRMLGQDGQAATRDMEAAVLAGRCAAEMGRGAEGFVPQAMAGFVAVHGGSVPERLAAWLVAAERATRAALLQLDRLRDWGLKAEAVLADLQGRTPALMVALFTEWVMVTAPMAEAITGAAKATVQRNLTLMQGRGLVREVTGQGRYRVWTAKM